MTARRAAAADSADNLLPAEFAASYHQKFVDRLWMTGLGATLVLYAVGCVIYFIAEAFLSYQTTGVEKQVASLSQSYTNALQIKARYGVLKDRQDLKVRGAGLLGGDRGGHARRPDAGRHEFQRRP